MKLKFTLLGISLFLLFNSALFAQAPNALVVTEPAEAAGVYAISIPTDWGGTLPATLLGTAVFSNDGAGVLTDACEDSVEELGTNWGIADRGDCQFSLKALHLQRGGANVAVICNNAAGAAMGEGPPGMAAGDNADEVTIPVIGLSFETCQRLRATADGEDVVLTLGVEFRCGTLEFGPEYIWGTNPGEGDFEGGLGEWTIDNFDDSGLGWLWTQDPNLDNGGSNCNGYLSFPSVDYGFPPSPICATLDAQPVQNTCDGTLISPNIDINPDDIDNLVVEFNHFYNYLFGGLTNLVVSFDDGVSWPDTFNISAAANGNGTVVSPFYPRAEDPCIVNAVPNQTDFFQSIRIPINTYAGQENIRLQFLHVGAFLDATIDDVALLSLPDYHDIELGQQFVSYAPAFQVPLSQAQGVPLHVDVLNNGISSVAPVVTAVAFDDSNTQVFETTFDGYGLQPGRCFLNQNLSLPDFYTPASLGEHTVLIQNVTPEDARVTGDDIVGFNFFMTENTWASTPQPRRFTGGPDAGELIDLFSNFDVNVTPQWAMAYPFFVPNGTGHFLNTVRFGIQARTTNNGSIFAYVLRWTPGDISFPDGERGAPAGEPAVPENYFFHPDESEVVGVVGRVFGFNSQRIPIATNVLDVNDNPVNFEDINITIVAADDTTGQPITNNQGEFLPLELEDNSHYILVFAMVPNDDAPIGIASEFSRSRDVLFHGASNFAYANAGLPNRPNAHFASLTDGFSYEAVRDLVWSGATEWGPNTPWIEMDINPVPLVTSSTEDINPEVAKGISIFPNPVSDKLTINVELNEVSSSVQFELMNINGEIIRSDSYNEVQKGTFDMNVADLISGVYTLNVRTEAGFTAKKVIIQK